MRQRQLRRHISPRRALWVALTLGATLAVVAVAGCNKHAVDPFSENIVAEQEDRVNFGGANAVDILWIVDNSGSMCEEQDSLRREFNSFMELLIEVGVDFQMAVITTDMEDPLEMGRFQNVPDGETSASCEIEIDVSNCPPPSELPLIMKSSDARYQDSNGNLDLDKIQLDFGCIATTGTKGSGFEMGLEAARTALDSPLIDGHNSGFLRDNASLAVVFITDENDCSDRGALDKVNGNICEWEEDKLVPVQEYIDFFSELKGSPDRVIMAGIIAPDNEIRYEYGEDVEPSCITATGRGFASYRYQELIESFNNQSSANICEPPFDDALGGIAALIVEALDNKCLDAPPPTCESSSDCGGNSCGPRGEGGRNFCEQFRVQVEVLRPESVGGLDGRECASAKDGTLRCILNEGQGNDYVIDYAAAGECPNSGIAVDLFYELEGADELIVRYPRLVGQ